jgi:hypothetical protein
VERIADQNPHLHRRDVESIVNAILDAIIAAMARGDRIELRGFGNFSVMFQLKKSLCRISKPAKRFVGVLIPPKLEIVSIAGRQRTTVPPVSP